MDFDGFYGFLWNFMDFMDFTSFKCFFWEIIKNQLIFIEGSSLS